MKKILTAALILTFILALTACGSAPAKPPEAAAPTAASEPAATAAPETPAPETAPAEPEGLTVGLYIPNDNADGFDIQEAVIPALDPAELMKALIQAGVFPEGVSVNSFELSPDGGLITVDMDQAFMEAFFGNGTAGEYMLMGSFVNSFLDAYGAGSMDLTVDGGAMETGHSIYDFTLTHMD